jgi:hypothetical protein
LGSGQATFSGTTKPNFSLPVILRGAVSKLKTETKVILCLAIPGFRSTVQPSEDNVGLVRFSLAENMLQFALGALMTLTRRFG